MRMMLAAVSILLCISLGTVIANDDASNGTVVVLDSTFDHPKVFSQAKSLGFPTSAWFREQAVPELGLVVKPRGFCGYNQGFDFDKRLSSLVTPETRGVFVNLTLVSLEGIKKIDLQNLQALGIGGLSFYDHLWLAQLSNLELLDLSDTNVTAKDLDVICKLPRLKWMSLGGTALPLDEIESSIKNSSIEVLFCHSLLPLEKDTTLRSPHLRCLDISNHSGKTLSFEELPSLETLYAYDVDWKSVSLDSLQRAAPKLKSIYTNHPQIMEAHWEWITDEKLYFESQRPLEPQNFFSSSIGSRKSK